VKASFGRVPVYPEHRDPELPGGNGWESLEHIGPITRTVEDSRLLLDVIAGPHHLDRHSLPTDGTDYKGSKDRTKMDDLQIAYSQDLGYVAVDPEVKAIIDSTVEVFEEKLGCTVEQANPGFPDVEDAFTALVANNTDLKELRKSLYDHKTDMEPVLVDILETDWTAEDFTEAYKSRQKVNNKMRKFMKDYDLLLTPTLAVPPFDITSPGPTMIDDRAVGLFHWVSFTFPINFTGQPAVSVPADQTSNGLPVGLQIVGSHLDDETVLDAAAAYQDANPWLDRKPPVLD